MESLMGPGALVYIHFYSVGIYPFTNMSAALHIYGSFYYCFSVHIDCSLVHTCGKKKQEKNNENKTFVFEHLMTKKYSASSGD